MANRKQLITEARTWLGTPFAHQGRIKGQASDCVGMGLCVAQIFGLQDKLGRPLDAKSGGLDYSAQPMSDLVLEGCKERLHEISPADMREGDVLCLRSGAAACHTALVTRMYEGTPNECLGIIHAYSPAGRVVETVLNDRIRDRIAGAFQIPGVED
jgi:hypothetical protein